MKIGLVITVKNEERIIRENILYHNFIGVDQFYIYLDDSTDKTAERVFDLPFVEVNNSIDEHQFENIAELKSFVHSHHEHHTARQCLNSFDALQKCRDNEVDWLISIDADELVCPDIDPSSKNSLKTFFLGLPIEVQAIQFQVYEAFQRQFEYENVFKEETLFKSRWKFSQRLDRLYKKIYDPFTKEYQKMNFWYGQNMSKMAIKTALDFYPKNVHRFHLRNHTKPIKLRKGKLLHYHAFDYKDFIKKFKNFEKRPDTFLSGSSIGYVKKLWRDLVNSKHMNGRDLERYYYDYVMFNEAWIKKAQSRRHFGIIPRKESGTEKVVSVQEVFENIEE